MSIKAVIFDIYNTLFDNDTIYWKQTFKEICKLQDLRIDPEKFWYDWKSIEITFRQNRLNMENPSLSPPFKTYQTAWKEAFEITFEKWKVNGNAEHAAQVSVDSLSTRPPYPDTYKVIDDVQRERKVAFLTNADNASVFKLFENHNISTSMIFTSEQLQTYKPNPIVFETVLKNLHVEKYEAVYVGDTLLEDMHGSKMAGIAAIWINRTGISIDPELIPPDHQIKELRELAGILKCMDEVRS